MFATFSLPVRKVAATACDAAVAKGSRSNGRQRLSCKAENGLQRSVVSTPQPRMKNGSMIRSLAAAVELTSQVQRYETFAGRSAMVGVAAAVFVELITDHGIFLPVDTDTALTYAGVALATIASSVGVALAKGRSDFPDVGNSVDLLEAVYASLTAAKRSAASVTQAQVDKAVDYLLENVLDNQFEHYSIESLMISTDDEL